MKRTLEIEFLLDNAKTKTLSLTDPKDDISATAVQTWAENVVAKKALLIGGAFPVAYKGASIRKVDIEELA